MNYHDNVYECKKIEQYILSRESLYRDRDVLDAGGGTGHILYALPNLRSGIVIDIDKDALLKSGVENRILGDIGHLPFIDTAFDLSIFVEVIEHLLEPQKSVNELHRVSRNIVVTTPNNSIFRRVLWKLRRKSDLSSVGHVKEYSPKELKNLFLNAGFELRNSYGVGFIVLQPRFLYDLGEVVHYVSSKILMEFARKD